MITSEIIADSLNTVGNRLTTFILEYPRFIHSELMTHRVFSKNAASSRAIPIEKMIKQVIDNPAMPEFWGKNQSGMQANEELDNKELRHKMYVLVEERKGESIEYNKIENNLVTDIDYAKNTWLETRNVVIGAVQRLNDIGLHKQISNRLLEPWFNIRIILSGTEFDNFFALRAHKDAQPELQKLAYLMLEEYNKSEPKSLQVGEWHIPFGDKMDNFRVHSLLKVLGKNNATIEEIDDAKRKIAISRCARVSYFNYEGKDDYEADIKLCDRLFANNPKHLSPTEHVAQSQDNSEWYGNFRGFKQYRKFFKNENLKDERIKKYYL